MNSENSENPAENVKSRARHEPFERERAAILSAALDAAPFEGFTNLSIKRAAAAAGVSPAASAAAFPRGAVDLVEYWSHEADEAAADALRTEDAQALKIREKVALGVEARLDYLSAHKEASRRAAAFLALPQNAPTGARLTWRSADAIWRALKDPSTDFNFYSKRAILSGVLTSTFARWMSDDSEDRAATREFLKARIENVMQFEKMKAKVRDKGFDPEGMFGWLAKLRYPEKS
ncbi:MAG: COQ9 family protein [Parvularculaceae bacterium]